MKAKVNGVEHLVRPYAFPKRGLDLGKDYVVPTGIEAVMKTSGKGLTYFYVKVAGATYYLPANVDLPSGATWEVTEQPKAAVAAVAPVAPAAPVAETVAPAAAPVAPKTRKGK